MYKRQKIPIRANKESGIRNFFLAVCGRWDIESYIGEHWGDLEVIEEVILPIQYFERSLSLETRGTLTMVQQLLRDALVDFAQNLDRRNYRGSYTHRFEEDRLWFFSGDEKGVYNFEYICELLNIDPEKIREVLRRCEADPFCKERRLLLSLSRRRIKVNRKQKRITPLVLT